MHKLHNALIMSKLPKRTPPHLFSMAQLSSQNSHTSSTHSISYKKYRHNKLLKSNESTQAIINNNKKTLKSRQKKYKQPKKSRKQTIDTDFDKIQAKSQYVKDKQNEKLDNRSPNKRMLEIEIQNYSQRRYNRRNPQINKQKSLMSQNSYSLHFLPTKSIQYKSIQIYEQLQKDQKDSGNKFRRKYKKAIKKSITQRNSAYSLEPQKQEKSQSLLKNDKNKKVKSRRNLKRDDTNYGSSINIGSRKNSRQLERSNSQNTTKKIIYDCLNYGGITKKQQLKINEKKQDKYFEKEHNIQKQIKFQRCPSKSKSKRRILTQITPRKQKCTQKNNNFVNVKSQCLQSNNNEVGDIVIIHENNKIKIQNTGIKQNPIFQHKINSLADFSSIMEINQSSFLSEAGKNILFNSNQPSKKNSKVGNQLHQYKNPCKEQIKQNEQKKPIKRYFDENIDPINLSVYRSIPVNSIAASHSKKLHRSKNVMQKIKKVFPKGFFDS